MQQLGFTPTSKESGLREFQKSGWVLLDATYEPVNELDDRSADRVIIRDYHLLRDDLAALLSDRSAPIILMKANVCRLLEPKLAEDGFNVLNHGRAVYFPNNGRQPDFKRQFSAILKSAKIDAEKPRGKKPSANKIGDAALSISKYMLDKSKGAFDYVIKEHGEDIFKKVVDAGVTAIKRKYGVMITPDQHNVLGTITANQMADDNNVDRKRFRKALRDRNFSWHTHGDDWEVEVGSPEHQDMLNVLATLT
jgi:hypothetical protein